MKSVIVSPDRLHAGVLLDRFTAQAGNPGAVVSFSGQVRGDQQVERLTLTCLEPMTTREIEAEAERARARFRIDALCIRHRIGSIAVGEMIVFCAAAADHRRAAFQACDYLMDYLKTRAVFWKREDGPDGSRWIEPRGQDYDDAQRWMTGDPCP